MRIANIMFGKGKGGLEQAAFDYHEALQSSGHDVITLLSDNAAMLPVFEQAGFACEAIRQWGNWDYLARKALQRRVKHHQIDVMTAHGNRAMSLAINGAQKHAPLAGVAHNYNINKTLPKCDAAFCITRDLMDALVQLEVPRGQLFHVPNLVRLPDIDGARRISRPPVIGALGRFVHKKGMDVLIQALHALAQEGIAFQAVIAGDGPLLPSLRQQVADAGLQEQVQFPGWSTDIPGFMRQLDLFVLPSRHEPFGIVLIEAMASGLACVTTATEGPCEIIRQQHDAVMVDIAQPHQMAQEMAELLQHPERLQAMGAAARQKVASRYALPVVAETLDVAVQRVREGRH